MTDHEGPEDEAPPGPGLPGLLGEPAQEDAGYRVLARKYRPQSFEDLIGQEAMVRTLENAFRLGRIAHAFMLTGVRGVGKTTTARIIAKGLNCIGAEGDGGPTVRPCGVCPNCVGITQSRHPDVFEMDAASRTGIDDIREVIEGARYTPVQARTKVYIIDEVHMLSKAAFNGLLKTLEEPPAHVTFLFATTEVRRVPVTVLSRCQRFDLKRVEAGRLVAHLEAIAKAEGASAETGALGLLARAAEGSVRDSLSLLDQAIALARTEEGAVAITEEQTRAMLGLADRGRIIDLFEKLMAGDLKSALEIFAESYEAGADPAVTIADLLNLTHTLTRAKAVGTLPADPTLPEAERARLEALAGELSVGILGRAWQLLLKIVREVREAPDPNRAAEMGLIRLAYAADLPTPAEALRKLAAGPGIPATGAPAPGAQSSAAPAPSAPAPGAQNAPQNAVGAVPQRTIGATPQRAHAPRGAAQGAEARAPEMLADAPPPPWEDENPVPLAERVSGPAAAPAPGTGKAPSLPSFEAVVALIGELRDIRLKTQLEDFVHLTGFEPGRIEFRPAPQAPGDLAGRLAERLLAATGTRWVITLTNETGAPTLREKRLEADAALKREVKAHPLVAAALEAFPAARIAVIRDLDAPLPDDGPGEDDDS